MQTNITEVSRLSKHYQISFNKSFVALKQASFEVRAAEIVSFIGANGAGKSTLLKVLAGINQPTEGSVKIFNQLNNSQVAKNKIAFMPENPQFFGELNALQTLKLFASFYNDPVEDVSALLKLVGLENATKKPINNFSKGMKQRLGFAQCLVGNPLVIFLDEPLDGLDPIGRRELKQNFINLKKKGVTIVLCSHILSDIDEVSDRIGVIHRGKVLKLTTPKQFKQNHSLEQAFFKFIKSRS